MAATSDNEIQMLESMIKERDENIERLQQKLVIKRFGVERFSKDYSIIMFYTGFMTFSVFSTIFVFIKPTATSMTSHYFKRSAITNPSLTCRQRTMIQIDEFFVFVPPQMWNDGPISCCSIQLCFNSKQKNYYLGNFFVFCSWQY